MTQEKEATQLLHADRITVGLATCGLSAGGQPVFDALKKANVLPVMKTGCVGMCYAEPIVTVVQDGVQSIYGPLTIQEVPALLKAIKKRKRYEKRFLAASVDKLPFYKKQQRIVLAHCGIIDPTNISQYEALNGFTGLKKALLLKPSQVIDVVEKAGLRGRGGAGFPTARKWRFIADKKGQKYLICNGDEGDPGAFMNRTLMESDPFKIIEGLIIGAYATGVSKGIIYTRAEYPLAIKTLQEAIDICYKHNFLGEHILGNKNFHFDLRIQQGAGAYVCGEETALLASLEGLRGSPRPRPPYPAQSGLFGKPTIVNNVGTWGHVATIFQIGVTNYAQIGSKFSKGTKILCLSGKIQRTGVIEVPFGITLKEIIYDIGGGTPLGTQFKALFPGGPAGGCIVEKDLGKTLDYESMKELETIMGSGSFIITNTQSCMVNMAKFFMTFTTQESCGKCTPCREGTTRLLEMLTKVSRGNGTVQDIDKIKELAEFVSDASLCGLGQFAPNPVLSTIKHFRKEYEEHILHKTCPAHVCENLLKYEIVESKCIGCGACKAQCPVHCISGDLKKPHVIDQSKCIKCGKCYEVCAFDAITKK
ncbi:4Fe-4S binding protein [Candidatus Woesearchaeota archaeon]|nr:4Fe-4S binding protein [Candidatus Woesearchaeota archaeon]